MTEPAVRRRHLLSLLALPMLGACAAPVVPGLVPRASTGFAGALARALPYAVGVYGSAHRRVEDESGAGPTADAERGADPQPYARIGAGFMVDAQGLVVTAGHVVTDTDQVVVKLDDQRVLAAQVIGIDADTDIALLRIDYRAPRAPPLGRASTLRPGHWVLAIGEPYGLNRSVSAGVVGGTDRHFVDEPELLYLQTDLALNPGNSGGPLVDAGGNIVGMNVRTVIGAYGAPGVSLSIPIEVVNEVVAELLSSGSVTRPRLGAEFVDLSPTVALMRGRRDTSGALVTAVRPGSLAERLGLQVDDIVVGMQDRPIANSADLARLLLSWRVLAGTRLRVLRDGQPRDLRLE
ncbi:MAG: trypsin-like peptidase domain-containing protein [Piscinibacter sp.]|nr:trypsin-like peptidase domain-containing protein [Piscinibacter sp.]